ncbi:MAG: phosphate ABC transporter permease subunit PstC [Methanomassiliicoccaceae archaeon]|nr:phosphate ABC transporter permease subunit PstC [Methanomassiliicoccaceae archaeon]
MATERRPSKRKNVNSGSEKYLLTAVSAAAVAIVFIIIFFVIYNSIDALTQYNLWDFLTGRIWSPSSGQFGAFPAIMGTILVTIGALVFAVPIGISAAVFLSEVVPEKVRNTLKPICEIFAGIPSIVYGFFGLILLGPVLQSLFPGHMSASFSWLTASIILGIMALPTIISVSDDAMRAVPRSYREASMAMGATKWETTKKITVPAAFSGISAAVMLGMGRAIGETMVVMMVAGSAMRVPGPLWDVFEWIEPLTSLIASDMKYVSDPLHYSALFLLALVLFAMVFLVNYVTRIIIKNTKRKFEEGEGMLEKHLPRKVKDAVNRSKRPAFLFMIFIVVWMAASLFFSNGVSACIAFACTLLTVAVPYIAKLFRPIGRQKIAHCIMAVSMIIAIGFLVAIFGDIIIKGIGVLSIEFLTGYPVFDNQGNLVGGGIFPAILGTIQLAVGTAMIAIPLGFITGIYLSEFARKSRFTNIIRSSIDILNGTPSIVFGLFAAVTIVAVFNISLITGCIILAIVILPVVIKTTEEAVKAVPGELREASMAMGATKWETTIRVIVPAAMGGILTGIVLALGRAAGETAPILYAATVVWRNYMVVSPFDANMALPVLLFSLSSTQLGSDATYGTALVLMILVLVVFSAASYIRYYYSKKVRW